MNPDIEKYKYHTLVLVDDIISTAQKMIVTIQHLYNAGMKAPICIGVHAVFANDAYNELVKSGIMEVITCNTIPHESNKIDISEMIINELKRNE